MSDKTNSHSGSADEIVSEHERVRKLLAKLAESDDWALLREVATELQSLLRGHFAHEESPDGLHQIIGFATPWNLRQVDDLVAEHSSIVTLIDALVAGAEDATDRDAVMKTRAELGDLLKRHEARETELLSEAMNTELGGRG
mgnify:CR=1 FL=1